MRRLIARLRARLARDAGGHCWHASGGGVTLGFYGARYNVVCCRCGTRGARDSVNRPAPLDGHGPHFTADQWTDGDVEIYIGTAECPAGRGA